MTRTLRGARVVVCSLLWHGGRVECLKSKVWAWHWSGVSNVWPRISDKVIVAWPAERGSGPRVGARRVAAHMSHAARAWGDCGLWEE